MAWSKGDLAECINDEWNVPASLLIEPPPVKGEIRRVTGFKSSGLFGLPYLCFGTPVFYYAPYFRKIVHTHEPASADFTALIKQTTKPKEPA